jgi:hypothetical protein
MVYLDRNWLVVDEFAYDYSHEILLPTPSFHDAKLPRRHASPGQAQPASHQHQVSDVLIFVILLQAELHTVKTAVVAAAAHPIRHLQ